MGHQVRKQNFSSREAAEEFYHSSRRQIRSGEWISAKTNVMKSMSLDELYEFYKKRLGSRRAEATIKNGSTSWRIHISPVLGKKKAHQITKGTLAHFVAHLRDKGLKDNSIKVVKAELQNVLKLAFNYDLIKARPIWPKLVAEPKKKEIFSPLEIKRVIDALDCPQYKVMAFVQYSLALRVSELVGLRPGAFNLDNKTVMIDRQAPRHPGTSKVAWIQSLGPTKNRIKRLLPISDELVAAVRPYVEHRADDVPLWINGWLNPVGAKRYAHALKKASKIAGINRQFSSHCMRTSMLSYLINHSGLPATAVAWFGRHDVSVLLKRYSEADEAQVFGFFQPEKRTHSVLDCNPAAILTLEVE